MDIKAVFYDLGHSFYAAFYDSPQSQEEFIRLALDHLSSSGRRQLNEALTEILDRGYSDAELQAMWDDSDTDVFFAPGAIRRVLAKTRDWLARNAHPPASE